MALTDDTANFLHEAPRGFLQTTETNIAEAMNTFVFDVYGALVADYIDVIISCGVLYILFYVLAILRGHVKASTQELISATLKFIVIMALLTNYYDFLLLANNALTKWPESIIRTIISAISNTAPTTGIGPMDLYFDQGMKVGQLIFDMGSWRHWLPWFYGAVMMIATFLLSVIPLGMASMATVGIAILLGIAPLFLVFKFYNSTKGFFEGWVKNLMTLVFIKILSYCVMVVSLFIIKQPFERLISETANNALNISDTFAILVMAFVIYMLYKQIGGIATSLGGGFYMMSSNFAETVLGTAAGQTLGRILGRK